ncbi:zinc finger protein 91-like [Cydia amplana]|uniref:zinc finger protein 91-like n=1 Tax=Cydia amplana TaxID=1869771 RepID=UPI002FE52E64
MMSDIKLEPDDLEICRGCLSSDRRLSFVATDDFRSLLTDDQSQELDHLASIALCWECMALLRKTRKFQGQVQRAHTILQDSLQLTPAKATLSSLSFYQNIEYDAVFEESTPDTELPLSYETPEHHKVIVPTKYKTQLTSSIENVKTLKVVLNDIYGNVKCNDDIKVEHHDADSDADDNEFEYEFEPDDRNYSSSEEITETKIDTRRSLRQAANNTVVNFKDSKKQKTPKLSKEISTMKTKKVIVTKQNTPKKRKANSIENGSVEIGTTNYIDNNTKVESYNSDAGSQYVKAVASKRKKHVKLEDDPDFKLEDIKGEISSEDKAALIEIHENKAKDDKEKPIKKKERSILTQRLKYKKIFTKYKKIEDVLQYFEEVEMSQEDIKSALEKDDAIVDKKYPVKCSICGMLLMFVRSLDRHAYLGHRKDLPDLIVNKRFIYPPLKLPQKSVWRCRVCARMMRKEHIVAHVNRYHCMQYFCIEDGCELYQKEQKYFWEKEHCAKHWDEIHKRIICDICNIRKMKKKSMEVHMIEAHSPPKVPKPIKCPHCSKTYTNRQTLRKHTSYHEPEPAERRYCVECDITFKRVFTFKAHFRTFHSGKPRTKYPCTVCGKVMKRRTGLKLHMNFFHIGVTDYRCHICGKYLFNSSCLKDHLDIHNNIKPKKPKRNLPCTVCGRTFKQKTSLDVHMNTHTGDRPYKCPHCEAAFTQPFVLRTHLAKHHNVNASVRANGDIIPLTKTDGTVDSSVSASCSST